MQIRRASGRGCSGRRRIRRAVGGHVGGAWSLGIGVASALWSGRRSPARGVWIWLVWPRSAGWRPRMGTAGDRWCPDGARWSREALAMVDARGAWPDLACAGLTPWGLTALQRACVCRRRGRWWPCAVLACSLRWGCTVQRRYLSALAGCVGVVVPGESLAGARRPIATAPVGVVIVLGGIVGICILYSRIKIFG